MKIITAYLIVESDAKDGLERKVNSLINGHPPKDIHIKYNCEHWKPHGDLMFHPVRHTYVQAMVGGK